MGYGKETGRCSVKLINKPKLYVCFTNEQYWNKIKESPYANIIQVVILNEAYSLIIKVNSEETRTRVKNIMKWQKPLDGYIPGTAEKFVIPWKDVTWYLWDTAYKKLKRHFDVEKAEGVPDLRINDTIWYLTGNSYRPLKFT